MSQPCSTAREDYLIKSEADARFLSRVLRYAVERAGFQAELAYRERHFRALIEHTHERAEEELREAEDKLRQAQKMEAVGRLAGGVAHDFNNILTAIFGYADLLLSDLDAGTIRRRADVEEIRLMARARRHLTRQLLAFSRKQMLQPQRRSI